MAGLALLFAQGCAKDLQQAAPAPAAAETGTPLPVASASSDYTSPRQTLNTLRDAVRLQDLNRVVQTFAPSFRPVLQQWIEQAGTEAVLAVLGHGLESIPQHIEQYTVVAHQPPHDVQWTVVTDNWPEALAAYEAAVHEYGPSIEVWYAGLPWWHAKEGWLLAAW